MGDEPRTQKVLGIEPSELTRDHQFTQGVGAAAHDQAFHAFRAPSATGVDEVLAVFPENVADAVVHVDLVRHWRTINDLTI